ncbi:hypothetical protein [Nocardia sp. NPDC004860]|uniref:hypothetical protein n=1 Tax=Nocardia sp. NPDC004860 TaxID=3154557 RepID=UPI0033B6F63F
MPSLWPDNCQRPGLKSVSAATNCSGVDVIGGNYSDATAKFGVAKAHMMDVADVLSQGIITQFPDKF